MFPLFYQCSVGLSIETFYISKLTLVLWRQSMDKTFKLKLFYLNTWVGKSQHCLGQLCSDVDFEHFFQNQSRSQFKVLGARKQGGMYQKFSIVTPSPQLRTLSSLSLVLTQNLTMMVMMTTAMAMEKMRIILKIPRARKQQTYLKHSTATPSTISTHSITSRLWEGNRSSQILKRCSFFSCDLFLQS